MPPREIPPKSGNTFPVIGRTIKDLVNPSDVEHRIKIALTMLAEFTHSDRIAFIQLEAEKDLASGRVVGLLRRGETVYPNNSIRIDVSPFKDIIESKEHCIYKMASGSFCLCLPLIDLHDEAFGIIVLDQKTEEPLPEQKMQTLILLTSLIAVLMGNASQPQATAFDSMTGFYKQDHFEVRFREEIARTKRQGCQLVLVATELDQFKQFNETYGNHTGNIILRELSTILRYSIRKDVDIPYYFHRGRFVVILPNTDERGSIVVAERIGKNCEIYPFPHNNETIKLTICSGLAVIYPDTIISQEQFFDRTIEMLKKAKENGPNQIMIWE
ncbi:MAG: GGDEF domain-containing protein [Candidatus Electryoneaceae bacterium]|nr:GGDEF domain-containing protein [Candidatus Electryoneaceae bacterium]